MSPMIAQPLPVSEPAAEASAPGRALPLAKSRRSFSWQRGGAMLGLAWVNGAFHAASFRRQVLTGSWSCPHPVATVEEIGPALDAALAALKFTGTDAFLILEHEQFQHQPEQAPAFSEAATRNFLRARVARLEQEREPMLWVSQRTSSQRNEASVLLHLLAASVYDRINQQLLLRRLELTRIVPLLVPLQLAIDALPEAKDQPVLAAVPAGQATIVVAARAGQPILFTRSILAPWEDDPARLAVELNRSLLYAKQQFGTVIDRLRLLHDAPAPLLTEVRARCGSTKDVAAVALGPTQWLQAVARLSPRHPVNLVAGHLGSKQRQRVLRTGLIGLCSLAMMLSALDVVLGWGRGQEERARLAQLAGAEPTLALERDRLRERNDLANTQARRLAEAEALRVPPVPARFLAYLPTALPAEARLTQLQVYQRDEGAGWAVRLEGLIEADEDTARELFEMIERNLARGAFRVRIPAAGRAFVLLPADRARETPALRFTLEGGLLEN